MIFSIYKATNLVNGKIYIGFDSNWPNRQFAHKSLSFNKNCIEYNYIFHKAIRKHGWDKFEWEVLYEHYDGEYVLNVVEPYFIDVYDSFYLTDHGYNMTKGGEGSFGRICSKETKEKMSNAKKNYIPWIKGRSHSDQTKQKLKIPKTKTHIENMSKALKGRSSPMEGKEHSNLTKQKISQAKKGKISICKSYILIDPEGNKFNVTNLTKFCRDNPQYNLISIGNLINVANGIKHQYKGWKCFYS